jgi:hypothetical protein
MISFLEKMMYVFGAYVNCHRVFNLLIRPALWSTNNTFLVCFLSINFFYLIIQISIGDANDQTNPDDDMIIQYLEYSFSWPNHNNIHTPHIPCGLCAGAKL